MTPMRDRPTSDLVILAFTAIIAAVIAASLIVLVVVAIREPDADLSDMARNIKDVTNTLIAAVVGYVAGRVIPIGKGDDDDDATR